MADGYIPARKSELIAAMAAEGGLPAGDEPGFIHLAQLIAAILHFESYEALEQLKSLYAPLAPEAPPSRRAIGEEALAVFEHAFEAALRKANFETLGNDIGTRGETHVSAELRLRASTDGIRAIRYFPRGSHSEPVTLRSWFGLRKKVTEAEFVDDVIVLVAFADDNEIKKNKRKAAARLRRGVRPGGVLIKHFRNVAREELISLHPGARPTMRTRDQVVLAAPALAGGVPVALQLWPALTVLFTLLTIVFGAQGAVSQSQAQQALAALSGLLAVLAFVMRQKMRYEHQTLLYQKKFSETVYFRNVANNAGVLDALINSGEEQDMKEALLAYWVLRRANGALAKSEIDKAAEEFLRLRFALAVDFEIGDALGKLERLGLVMRTGDTYAAIPCADALATLDGVWDALFKFAPAPISALRAAE